MAQRWPHIEGATGLKRGERAPCRGGPDLASAGKSGSAAGVPRLALGDRARFEAWLAEVGDAVVLFAGEGCPYSRRFEAHFLAAAPALRAPAAVRMVEEGGHGPVAERLGVDVTPTVACYRGREEAARVAAVLLIGLTWRRFEAWARAEGILID